MIILMNHLVNFYRSMDTKHRRSFILLFLTQLLWSYIVGFLILYTVFNPILNTVDSKVILYHASDNIFDLVFAHVLFWGSLSCLVLVSFLIPYLLLNKTKSQKEINELKTKYKLDHKIKHLF